MNVFTIELSNNVKKIKNKSFWYSFTKNAFIFLSKSYKPVKVIDSENLLLFKKGIIISNHVSLFDPWIIASCNKVNVHFISKKELCEFDSQFKEYRQKGIGIFWSIILAIMTNVIVKNSLTILVDRNNPRNPLNDEAMTEARYLLEGDCIIGIFPQGGIDRDGAKKTPLRLAQKTSSVILPIYLQKPDKWNKNNPFMVVIGKPIESVGCCNALSLMEEVYNLKNRL